jgi:hypothetical protein
VVDSFADFNNFMAVSGDTGYSILSVWSHLVPLVVGWLQVGSQPEANHLRDALEEANSKLYVQMPSKPTLASDVPGRRVRAIEYAKHDIHRLHGDERRSVPIFNYARVFVWSRQADFIRRLYQNASGKADMHVPVNGGDWDVNDPSQNETGNVNQVVQYCLGDNLAPPTPDDQGSLSIGVAERHVALPLWAPGVFERVSIAAVLGIGLQWGTIGTLFGSFSLNFTLSTAIPGAAILIQYETPPVGLGCRSLTFVIYGAISTIVFLSLFLASILSHCARARPKSHSRTILGFSASVLRRTGKFIGVANGLALTAVCLMMLAGAYDNCFCLANVFAGPRVADKIIEFTDVISISSVYKFCISGTVIAVSSSVLYGAGIYFASPVVG